MSENNSSSAPVEASSSATANPSEEGQQSQIVQPTTKMIKSLKIKIDGQEVDEQLPFEVDENNKEQIEFLKRHLQMSKVSNKRMSEAAVTRKQAEAFIEALHNDPMKVLSDERVMGNKKFQAIAEQFLSKQLEDQLLSPEEKAQRQMQDKLRKYEEQEKEA